MNTTFRILSGIPFVVEFQNGDAKKRIAYPTPLSEQELQAEASAIVFEWIPKSAFVRIESPADSRAKQMLTSAFSFIQPMKVVDETSDFVSIRLFDCSSKEKMEERLDTLCEVSSIDFSYAYKMEP